MKTLFSTLILLAFGFSSQAQNLIAVQNGIKVQFYASLDSAYVHSADGDTIYVPGGSYDVSKIKITKQLFIFGVGYYPDSTKATNFSYLTGTLTINPGTKGGLLTGFKLCTIHFGDSSGLATTKYTISRCNIGQIIFTTSGNSSFATNNYFIENVIGKVNGGGSKNNFFLNNFIGILSNFSANNTFNHNIISGSYNNCSGTGSTENVADSVFNSTFENNIFIGANFSAKNCNVSNNLFVNGLSSLYLSGGNISSNNFHRDYLRTEWGYYVFVKSYSGLAAGEGVLLNYSYSDNYHLMSTCQGKNAGNDGTDIGIYGGRFSWKDGAIPSNPHIQKNSVFGTTDAKGNLKVNITVEAQNH